MGGMYFVQNGTRDDLERLALLLSAQVAHGNEKVNHFVVSDGALMGLVSHDKFGAGVMPRFVQSAGLWGMMLGELHDCEFTRGWRGEHPECGSDLEMLALLLRDRRLRENLHHMNGAFFVILWDPKTRTLVAANDRYGLYPMYWSSRNGRFCLASRVLCSVLAEAASGDWSPEGVAQIVTIDDFIGEKTLVKGVESFPQARVLTKTPDGFNFERYWQWRYDYGDVLPLEDLADEAGRRLVRAVTRQSKGRGGLGVTLSGGLDSRCVAAAATQADLPLKTFTWGIRNCHDRVFAARVAEILGSEHADCEYEHMALLSRFPEGVSATEGMCNLFDTHFVAHLDRIATADIVLNGFAGDAVLGGTFLRKSWMSSLAPSELARRIFARANALVRECDLEQAVPVAREYAREQMPSSRCEAELIRLNHLSTPDAAHRYLFENHVRRKTAMGTVLMRCVSESAACFYDYDFMDFVMSVPPELRYNHRLYICMLRRVFPEVAGVRWQTTLLPVSAPEWMVFGSKVFRRVCGAVERRTGLRGPISRLNPATPSQWLRGPFRQWVDDHVNSDNRVANEILSSAFYRQAWREHVDGKDRTRLLGAVMPLLGFAHALDMARRGKAASDSKPIEVRVDDYPE